MFLWLQQKLETNPLDNPDFVGLFQCAPIWPARAAVYEFEGEELEMFTMPMNTCQGSEEDNSEKDLAMVKRGLRESTFRDPDDPGRGEFRGRVSGAAARTGWPGDDRVLHLVDGQIVAA